MIRLEDDGRVAQMLERLPTPVELLRAVAVCCLIWGMLICLWVVVVP